MSKTLIKNAQIISGMKNSRGDVLIDGERIVQVGTDISHAEANIIDAEDYLLLPGLIDDQVHFREPGFTHKANILSEARAAVAGGVTSFMEMPNTKPQALTQKLLQDKYDIAAGSSPANYSFYMGASNDNMEEVLRTNRETVCGIKIFMGSSTGNMLVDDETVLRRIFSEAELLIATHCEDEATVRSRIAKYKETYGDKASAEMHGVIRSREACILSSQLAMQIARDTDARLHILHISTAEEAEAFDSETDLAEKLITSEACVHHMYFCDEDYAQLGNKIKCNPSIKTHHDREAIRAAVVRGGIDVIATDHAPHTKEEKSQHYWKAPSGLPLVQHSLDLIMAMVQDGVMDLELAIYKATEAVAICFQIPDRGRIEEGCYADLVLYDPTLQREVNPRNIRYHCGWSPLEGKTLHGGVRYTMVNGQIVYENGVLHDIAAGKRMTFSR